ncbi:MAG: YggT family protein [Spirochaetaceae bacterium]|jgi:YggT family protein|nr:YggT family protein [Spirochaetaceae bacterium]
MHNLIRITMNILGGVTGFYMILITVRILLSWFRGAGYGRPYEILQNLTDPYLDWFRRFSFLRTGVFDLSPIAALAVLSVLNQIFNTVASFGRISVGMVLALILSAVWSALSFILGFFIVILILRLIAYLTNRDVYYSFWRIIDVISQPILYRTNRFLFRKRLVNYLTGIISALLLLLVLRIGLGLAMGRILLPFLLRLPL